MREVIFEFVAMGPQVKVSAIDVRTKKEVCLTVPARLPQNEMERLALQKLRYRMEKDRRGARQE